MLASAFSNIRRDNFKLGAVFKQELGSTFKTLPDQAKIEQGDRFIRSKSFRAIQPRSRDVKPARELKATKKKKEGIKVQLGPLTLKQLLEVDVPVTEKQLQTVLKRDIDPDTGLVVERRVEELVDVPKKDSSGNVITTKKSITLGVLQKSLGEQFTALNQILEAQQIRTDIGINLLGGVLAQLDSLADLSKVDEKKADVLHVAAVATGALISLKEDPIVQFPSLVDGRFVNSEWLDENEGDFINWMRAWPFINEDGKRNVVAKGIGFLNPRAPNKFVNNRTFKRNIDKGEILDLGAGDRQMFPSLRSAKETAAIPVEIDFDVKTNTITFDDGTQEKAPTDDDGNPILDPEFVKILETRAIDIRSSKAGENELVENIAESINLDDNTDDIIDDLKGFLDTNNKELLERAGDQIGLDLEFVDPDIIARAVNVVERGMEALE